MEEFKDLVPGIAARTSGDVQEPGIRLLPGQKNAIKAFAEGMKSKTLDEYLEGSGYE